MNLPVTQPPRSLVLIDMAVTRSSPAGSCVLAELREVHKDFQVTVISDQFDPNGLDGVTWLRAAAPRGPVLARYVVFHLAAWAHLMAWKRRGGRADVIQATQGQLVGAQIAYAHFCHKAYWQSMRQTPGKRDLRWCMRWLTHAFNAWREEAAFRQARAIVVPSMGLARELASQYGLGPDKVKIVANPVATQDFKRPENFDRSFWRSKWGWTDEHLVLSFMALGDFERKGLSLLIHALSQTSTGTRTRVRLLIIGGQEAEIKQFQKLAQSHGVAECFHFAGMQQDVKPFLWSSDVFAFPSAYEIFSLAILQAAAAGLPVLVSQGLYGAEEFVCHADNGWIVARELSALVEWYEQLPTQASTVEQMGQRAQASVQRYSQTEFGNQWRQLLSRL
jgi:glycosyltransferase involved in cell wall biosynthesis